MDSFVSLAYATLAASRAILQQLLACLKFILESEDLSFWYKRKKMISMNTSSKSSTSKTTQAAQAAESHR